MSAEIDAPEEQWKLAEYALSFAAERNQNVARVARCYGFRVAVWDFLLPEGQAAELISQPIFTPLPNAPQHCRGLANVRGNIVPFYSLRHFFDGESTSAAGDYALLLGDASNGLLLAIDSKPAAINRHNLTPTAQQLQQFPAQLVPLIQETFEAEGRLWLMLNPQPLIAFLTASETE